MTGAVFVRAARGMDLVLTGREDGLVRLALSGMVTQKLLLGESDPLEEVLEADDWIGGVSIDMADVMYLDTGGLNWLLVGHKRLRAAGGRLVLHSLSPMSRNVIRVLNLQAVFELADSEADARQMLVQPQGETR